MPTAIIAIHRAVGATSHFHYEIRETEHQILIDSVENGSIVRHIPSGFRELEVINRENCMVTPAFRSDFKSMIDHFVILDLLTNVSEVAMPVTFQIVSRSHSYTIDDSGLPIPRSESY